MLKDSSYNFSLWDKNEIFKDFNGLMMKEQCHLNRKE